MVKVKTIPFNHPQLQESVQGWRFYAIVNWVYVDFGLAVEYLITLHNDLNLTLQFAYRVTREQTLKDNYMAWVTHRKAVAVLLADYRRIKRKRSFHP